MKIKKISTWQREKYFILNQRRKKDNAINAKVIELDQNEDKLRLRIKIIKRSLSNWSILLYYSNYIEIK